MVRQAKSTPRLFVPGTMCGFRRSLHKQMMHTALVNIEGVRTQEAARWYLGKRVCWVHKGLRTKRGVRGRESKVRATWGRVMRIHGNSGIVRCKFSPNLPAHAIGSRIRVYMFPWNPKQAPTCAKVAAAEAPKAKKLKPAPVRLGSKKKGAKSGGSKKKAAPKKK
mmetsp:Transcript_118891/g.167035  ORF Transcript_118891/g.167035 Transcript_118891/m.167035 type:complete len:165 (+) Transcript_118891:30-524(+)